MKLSHILTTAACSLALAGTALAQEDYHGFDPETVDALNARLEAPLSDDVLEVLSQSTSIQPCGGEQVVSMSPSDDWTSRASSAIRPGGETPMPVPTSPLEVAYPPLYEVLGVEAACEVMFNVSESGESEDVLANCSLPGFDEAATDIFADMEFTPAKGQDSPAIQNLIVPVNFCRPDEEDS
ncbi:hypothetical protein HY29_15585 [Hyphomonas beringensis]|uniref:TonB C-terminal domain-containing protein n=1 Tax=Hyphomonas beringensis TaxID=1280946 RepID=A0A062U8X8_9PROT|nr:hypothetical protein [Hyphomonas beringensis]KCZ54163.1 hypothetical protein HY29_15585 [Hyphomonas beringensis]